jgi:hypothetical protein
VVKLLFFVSGAGPALSAAPRLPLQDRHWKERGGGSALVGAEYAAQESRRVRRKRKKMNPNAMFLVSGVCGPERSSNPRNLPRILFGRLPHQPLTMNHSPVLNGFYNLAGFIGFNSSNNFTRFVRFHRANLCESVRQPADPTALSELSDKIRIKVN